MYPIDEAISIFVHNQSTFDATRLRHEFIDQVFAPVANLGADLAPRVQQKLADFYLNYTYTPENLHNSSYTQYHARLVTDVCVSIIVCTYVAVKVLRHLRTDICGPGLDKFFLQNAIKHKNKYQLILAQMHFSRPINF